MANYGGHTDRMGTSDAFFVGVSKDNPTSAATADKGPGDQTKNSAFLTVQSFTNFSAATGAITTAWLALQALDADRFDTRVTAFALALGWLLMSLITGAKASTEARTASFWVSSVFLGFLNSLTLFAAVIGVSSAT